MGKPEIRFKGYTDEWEQRKLNDVAEFSKGNGYSKGDLTESGTPIILYGRLYGVEIRSLEGHGTTLIVTIPAHGEENHAADFDCGG